MKAKCRKNRIYKIRCDRCGRVVEYVGLSAFKYANYMKTRDGRFLCKNCRGRENSKICFVYTGADEGDLICPSCGKRKHVVGIDRIRRYKRYYGNDCCSYVCRDCRRKGSYPKTKVCSVCGEVFEIKTRDAAYKHKVRYCDRPYICDGCRQKKRSESWVVTCRKCGETKELVSPSERAYWRYRGSVGKEYVCEKCRRLDSDFVLRKTRPRSLETTSVFKELVGDCRRIMSEMVASRFSKRSAEIFLSSLSELLKSKNIYDFDLDIVDGKIIGVYLRGVSLYGSIYVPFENHHSAFGRRGVPS